MLDQNILSVRGVKEIRGIGNLDEIEVINKESILELLVYAQRELAENEILSYLRVKA